MFYKRIPEASLFLVLTLLGASFLIPVALRLKYVELDEEFVYLKGFRRHVAVPLAEIVSVQQKPIINIKPAFIVFRGKTAFGKSVMFIPKRDAGVFKQDSAIEFVRSKAGFSGEWRRDA
jgi:hypothetical protein